MGLFQFVSFIGLFVLARTYASDSTIDNDPNERGNLYIDKLIEDIIETRGDEFDPYKLGESVFGFYKKILFVNVSCEVRLRSGYLRGLKTLHRTGDSYLTEQGDKLVVRATLGSGALDFKYEGSIKFLNIGPSITVAGNLAYIEVMIEFSVDSKTGRNGSLHEFFIEDIRDMNVWVSGLGPFNWALNPIIKGAKKIFKTYLKNLLESKIQFYIEERLPNFQFPVEGLYSVKSTP
ncbi:uncharacterized protein LOC129960673 [Argiope bruennichi]|nr:uncharacterized protein LOC129960673 [Argiope bruennichi]XP_055930208.1 uncharacterized protein LOC129960673 [Argiope bruennichi]XP_055930209.1 uncharacterized protein LOC129960673 [Argiope bruennichi]XP_055930210.1 uncharacterized protein LOC129960673 [Argiope bruennichi]KAF8790927.1 Mite allergen Lep d 7 like protein [Argiope bruennichi]